LQAALLFWKNLFGYLSNQLGFTANPYDPCVVNKIVDGKQCTVAWHVDDLKISHVDEKVVEEVVAKLNNRYGKETPLSGTRGDTHDYLGMTIDFSKVGKVIFSMHDYVHNLIVEAPDELLKGIATTPAASHLFTVNEKAEKLDDEKSEIYHHLVAKILYLSKRTRPDLQPTVAFLATRVKAPDVDDWKKLGRCLTYIRESADEVLTLKADSMSKIQWWIDASFAVHQDF